MGATKVMLTLLVVALVLRLWMFNSSSLQAWLENRVEIATPLTSWSRVLEGKILSKGLFLRL